MMPTAWWYRTWICPFGCGFAAMALWRPRAYLHAWRRHAVWPWRWFEAIGSRLPGTGWWWKA